VEKKNRWKGKRDARVKKGSESSEGKLAKLITDLTGPCSLIPGRKGTIHGKEEANVLLARLGEIKMARKGWCSLLLKRELRGGEGEGEMKFEKKKGDRGMAGRNGGDFFYKEKL